MRVRVIGLGTPHGDDAAGLALAERLQAAALPPQAEVVRCARALDVLGWLEGAELVLLADAVRSGAPAGTLHRLEPQALARSAELSTHALGVADVLALAAALQRRLPRIEILGIEAGSLAGEGLSAPVARGVERAAQLVRERIAAFVAGA